METISTDDLDAIAANARVKTEALSAPRDLATSTSHFKEVARHPDHAAAELVCRLWDLSSAYRQLARALQHGSLTIMAC